MNKDKVMRGCGKRVPGGAYLVTNLGPSGRPLNEHLFCPSWIPVDTEGNRVYPGAVGMTLMENPWHKGIYDLWDWIGETYYPYFPDFWEEVRMHGLSRRVSPNANFSLLTNQSYIIGFHRKGVLSGTELLYKNLKKDWVEDTFMDKCPCKKHFPDDDSEEVCVRFLWQLVDEEKDYENRLHAVSLPRSMDKNMDFYMAGYIPNWIKERNYKTEWLPAAMFRLPIHGIEVIEDPVEGIHENTVENILNSATTLPYRVVRE